MKIRSCIFILVLIFMSNPVYDIFISSAKKDFIKLPYLLKSIEQYLEGYDQIYICTPEKTSTLVSNKSNVHFLYEKEVLNLDGYIFNYRSNWIGQQFLKTFQDVTSDLYFTIDADVIINRPITLFTDAGKRILYNGWVQNHEPYFKFQKIMFDLPKVYKDTFVSDSNFMDRKIIQEMMDRSNYTLDSFLSKAASIIKGPQEAPDACYPAENEFWGSYAYKYHQNLYEPRQFKNKAIGRTTFSLDTTVWTNEDIEREIRSHAEQDFDAISLHDWFNS